MRASPEPSARVPALELDAGKGRQLLLPGKDDTFDKGFDRGLTRLNRTLDTTDLGGVQDGLHEAELFWDGVAAGRQSLLG